MVAVVEWSLILQVIWVSLVAGTGATVLFSLVVFASSRAAEARRENENPAIYGVLAVVCMTIFLGLVVLAMTVILNKS